MDFLRATCPERSRKKRVRKSRVSPTAGLRKNRLTAIRPILACRQACIPKECLPQTETPSFCLIRAPDEPRTQ